MTTVYLTAVSDAVKVMQCYVVALAWYSLSKFYVWPAPFGAPAQGHQLVEPCD